MATHVVPMATAMPARTRRSIAKRLAGILETRTTEGGTKTRTTARQYDTDRLYASVDDIVFNIKREDTHFTDHLPDGLERPPCQWNGEKE